MKQTKRLIGLSVVITLGACDRAALPTATRENASSAPSFAMSAGHFRSFMVPTDNSKPRHIALGSDGNMWFTESQFDNGKIGRVDSKGKITEFPVPDPTGPPDDIVAGLDGARWFTMPSGFPDAIGRVTTDGQFTTFGTCTPEECTSIVPHAIASGPDGNLWFTELTRNAVVKMTPSGSFTFYTIPTPGANPQGITVGPDGALWFTEFNTNQIGRIDVAGNFTEFGGVSGGPDRIAAGPDGNLWFTEPSPFAESRIGRITPAGVITEFQLADRAQARDIVAGPDGQMWFTEYGAGQLAQITTAGLVTEVQSVKGGPWGIGRGLDGTIWLTQIDGNRIGRFTLTP